MTQLERLVDEASSLGVVVDDRLLTRTSKLDGLYLHWSQYSLSVILLNRYRSQSVQLAVMAEELGHYFTCVGNALDQRSVTAVRAERAGRAEAYKSVLPVGKLHAAICGGSCTLYELASSFGLPEQFIRDAFQFYSQTGALPKVECFRCYVG